MKLRILIALFMLLPCFVSATEIAGRVIGVADGDTLTVLDANNNQYKIRLAEIDAPEKAQAFGMRSKQNLSDLCYGKQAVVTTNENDRYNRVIGKVICNGVDANKTQVQAGMAWAYRQYVKDVNFYQLESDAKINGRGLWIDSKSVPPWEFRRNVNKTNFN